MLQARAGHMLHLTALVQGREQGTGRAPMSLDTEIGGEILRSVRKTHKDVIAYIAPWNVPLALDVVAIEVHHFGPRGGEVFYECFLRVVAAVDFCDRPQLRV
jgi:hypothetical protein